MRPKIHDADLAKNELLRRIESDFPKSGALDNELKSENSESRNDRAI